MTAAPLPPEIFASVTRRITEAHDTWDSPHQFITLHWDGEQLDFGTLAAIDPGIHPDAYADLMARIAREAMDGEDEVFYVPGERETHGQMVDALLAVATITGTAVHGLPMSNPFGGRS